MKDDVCMSERCHFDGWKTISERPKDATPFGYLHNRHRIRHLSKCLKTCVFTASEWFGLWDAILVSPFVMEFITNKGCLERQPLLVINRVYVYLPIALMRSLILATYASMVATATIFTTSRTEAPKSMKWIALFRPIWIGPIISASLPSICSIL